MNYILSLKMKSIFSVVSTLLLLVAVATAQSSVANNTATPTSSSSTTASSGGIVPIARPTNLDGLLTIVAKLRNIEEAEVEDEPALRITNAIAAILNVTSNRVVLAYFDADSETVDVSAYEIEFYILEVNGTYSEFDTHAAYDILGVEGEAAGGLMFSNFKVIEIALKVPKGPEPGNNVTFGVLISLFTLGMMGGLGYFTHKISGRDA
eukprot:Colp12_sorted_trinity150504_noHs@28424